MVTDRITWADVSRYCYPGSPVDVPCGYYTIRTKTFMVSYVLYAFDEDGETYLRLQDGTTVNSLDYLPPGGWLPPHLIVNRDSDPNIIVRRSHRTNF